MTDWTAPSTGSFHINPAPGAPPHHVDHCTDACHERGRAGWFTWLAKDTVIDTDDDPNRQPWGGA